ncbi:hypothetical protein ACFCV3_29655 [Kribbella sp. NPDC056345]|uniref:hypothetical protein n=1 Tax=Kribbella sp. NPDC056345 TaxID=3345789 RepID=UPI0035E1B648
MQHAFPHQAPRVQSSRKRLSMAGLIVGGVLLVLAVLILVLLAALFVLGGGGDGERFAVVIRGFVTTSAVVGAVGLASLVFGLITRK